MPSLPYAPRWLIYGLREAHEGSPYRYIGLTTGTLGNRIGAHIRKSRDRQQRSPVSDWIHSVDENIIGTVIEQVDFGDLNKLHEREVYWIDYYRSLQGSLNEDLPHKLLNISTGGYSNVGGTAWNKGLKLSDEYRQKLSLSHVGQEPNRKGASHTEDTLAVIGAKSSQNWSDDDYKAKTNAARKLACSTGSWADKQRMSQMTSAHNRYHVAKGTSSKLCSFCTGRYPSY